MKKILTSIALLLFLHNAEGALQEGYVCTPTITNVQEVSLISFDDNESFSVYENEQVKLKFRLADILNELPESIESRHTIKWDYELRLHLEEMTGRIQLDQLEGRHHQRIQYVIADLLKTGKAQVFDKSKKEYVTSIITAEWSNIGGGDMFFLKGTPLEFDKEFFNVLTYI